MNLRRVVVIKISLKKEAEENGSNSYKSPRCYRARLFNAYRQNKKKMSNLEASQVMEIQSTDKGSTANIKAWAANTGHQYLGTVEEGELLKHYLRKASAAREQSHNQVQQLEFIVGKLKLTFMNPCFSFSGFNHEPCKP